MIGLRFSSMEKSPKFLVLKLCRVANVSSGSIHGSKKVLEAKFLEDYVKDWKGRKIASGVPENRCFLPFLLGSSRLDAFSRLSLPYIDEEFKMGSILQDGPNEKLEPPPYVHIRRNVYLVNKKRDDACVDAGCTSCSSICSEDCVCRVQSISCSKACRCPEACMNRPFHKEKSSKFSRLNCGWGVEATESINKGDFIIEYVGEVIDDAVCTQRLWDMKNKDVKNFYMCEIHKDFTIDATFKSNASHYLNHSCDPNCKLEKWLTEGKIRMAVFAARFIKVGEPLTCDNSFVQFGPLVKCHCGAANCQGYLGAKRKINLANLCWGLKWKRSNTSDKNYCILPVQR